MSDEGYPVECPQCGGMALHYSCWQCLGNGEFDLYEDNPNEYEPGEVERCDECAGRGSYTICFQCKYDSTKDSKTA